MPDMPNYLKQAIADYFYRPGVAAPIRPTSHTMSLWSAIIDADAGTGTELVGNGYVRAPAVWGNITLPSGVLASSFAAVFPNATSNWIAATHYGIHDHLGNLVQSLVALAAPTTVLAGNHAEASAGALIVTLS